MGDICKITWKYYVKNQKRSSSAYFKNRASADKFIKELGEDKKVEEIEMVENLTLADVR